MDKKATKNKLEPVPEIYEFDSQGKIIGIKGRTLEVDNQSEADPYFEQYFMAWVDGYQNDGISHNQAVKNALYFAQNDIRSMLEVNKHEYQQTLLQLKAKAVDKLQPYSEKLSAIRNYSELLQLDKSIILALYHFEYAAVEEQESNNELIEGMTSGHHRDRLDAYLQVIKNEPLGTDYMFFDNDGTLNFNVAERLGFNSA